MSRILLLLLALLPPLLSEDIDDPEMKPEVSQDQKLKQHFHNTIGYDNNAFPCNGKLKVQVSLFMYGIVAVDQIKNKVSLRVTLRIKWKDERLVWKPADYSGMNETLIDIETEKYKIWIPDLSVYESDGKSQFEQLDLGYAQLTHDGYIYASRAGQIQLNHKFSLEAYPFDIQNITITIKSMNFDSSQMELTEFDKTLKD